MVCSLFRRVDCILEHLNCSKTSKMKAATIAFGIGLIGLFLFLIGSGLAWFGARNLIRMWAWEKLTLKNNSETMKRWMRPPRPTSMKIYFFNVTNAEAVSEGALPIFTEVGPYVYELVQEKVNIVQLENFTLSYRIKNVIKFKPNLSGRLRETDLLTTINVPLAGTILTVYETVPEFVGLLDDIWQLFYPGQTSIFLTTTVRDILFDGITLDCTSRITEVFVACRLLESRESFLVRKEGKNFKFSFLYYKNGTSKETFQIYQGIDDLMKSVQFLGVNYSPTVNMWKNKYCDMINGSDGTQFSVLLTKTQKLYTFEKELCRSVYTEFEKEILKNGVPLYKFSNTVSLFASPEHNPDNLCFCRSALGLQDLVKDSSEDKDKETTEYKLYHHAEKVCFENGILPVMSCVGAPIVMSFPHFYLGDQSYLNYSGLNPVKELHESYFYVEPLSGLSVRSFKRLQFNIEVRKISDVQITSNLVEGVFPILWLEEEMQLPADLFKLLKYSLIEKKVLENGTYVLIVVGLLLITVAYGVYLLFRKPVCSKDIETYSVVAKDLQPRKGEARTRMEVWQSSKGSVFPTRAINLNYPQ